MRKGPLFVVLALAAVGAAVWWQGRAPTGEEPVLSVPGTESSRAAGAAPAQVADASPQAALSRQARAIAHLPPEVALAEAKIIGQCMRTAGGTRLTMPEGLTEEQQRQLLESSGVLTLECPPAPDPYRAYALAEHAAEAGNLQAQLDFPVLVSGVFERDEAKLNPELIAKYKRDAMRFLDSAMQAGSVEALSRLSENYDAGLLVTKDPLKAYAYSYARDQRVRSPISAQRVQTLGSALTPSQIAQGQQLAQSLLIPSLRHPGVK